jgi:predicted DNA-binding transcriptional regulator
MNYVHPIAIDSLALLLIAPLTDTLSIDEQAIVGAFLNVLGDLLSLNSAYLSYIQTNSTSQEETQDDKDIIEKSIKTIEEELKKLKQEKE